MKFKKIPVGRAKMLKKRQSAESKRTLRKLQEYLDDSLQEPIKILCGFWGDQADAITYQELRESIQDGTLTSDMLELWRQDYSVLISGRLRSLWAEAAEAGAASPELLDGTGFIFDVQSREISRWIERRGAELVSMCTKEQKEAIAALTSKKMRDGHTVDELARMIRPCIGLNRAQAAANARYYENVAATLKADHPRMSQESIRAKASAAAAKYAERQHRQRAMTIAQTESAYAYNMGADEAVRQAQEQGYLGTVAKEWCTSGDDAVCDDCARLDGTRLAMDDKFSFGRSLGEDITPPAHPRCACAVMYIESEPLKNAAGHSIIRAEHTTITAAPNSITQTVNAKGGITRNFYRADGKQAKQISNNGHGYRKEEAMGKHGEHAHDYIWDEKGNLTRGESRELTDEERGDNSDFL